MVGTRGRPITCLSENAVTNRRRLETRERVRRLRLQRKELATARPRLRTEHLQKGEHIIDWTSAAEEEEEEVQVPSENHVVDNEGTEYAGPTFSAGNAQLRLEREATDEHTYISSSTPCIDHYRSGHYPHQTASVFDRCTTPQDRPTERQSGRIVREDRSDCRRGHGELASPSWSVPSRYRSVVTIKGARSPSTLSSTNSFGYQQNARLSVLQHSPAVQRYIEETGLETRQMSSPTIAVVRRKRGRPPLNSVADARTMRRRQVGLLRQQRYRERQRVLQGLPPRPMQTEIHDDLATRPLSVASCANNTADYLLASRTLSVPATAEISDIARLGIFSATTAPEESQLSGREVRNTAHYADDVQITHFGANYNNDERVAQLDPVLPRIDGVELCEIEQISAQRVVAQKLCNHLIRGFNGCSEESHERQLRSHEETEGDNHHGLSETCVDPAFPSVLKSPEILSRDRLAQQRRPEAAQWSAMFCGALHSNDSSASPIKNVCLHKEQTQAISPDISFDIDSFLGFATSLKVARNGILYQPSPQARQNLSTDVHFGLEVSGIDPATEPHVQRRFEMLRDAPHLCFGRFVGAENITLHRFFPHLETWPGISTLTAAQLSRWTDKILHPAIYNYYPAHYTQHLPAGYQHALADSKARQVEARKVESVSYQSQQSISYCLQPEHLHSIWTDIQQISSHTPGLYDFRGAQIYLSAKGIKLQFKTLSAPSLLDAIENFYAYLEQTLDMECIQSDRFYVDIGKEICPPTSSLISDRLTMETEPQVYSWKRCCLEEYMRALYDGEPPAIGSAGQQYYEQNMLYHASSLTSETPKRSKLREGGLIYSQFYGSVKELSDASKCKPFDNDGLEEMALDSHVRRGIHAVVGGHLRELKTIECAYTASKSRAHTALSVCRDKSFGIREEHRIDWVLLRELKFQLQLLRPGSLIATLHHCPRYAWAVRTDVYLDFLRRSADKFATGFELILADSDEELVSQEETKMMAMFLRCLRFVFGGHQLQRETALWWSRKERCGEQGAWTWYGLGFCNTLARYGYCWIEPLFDWNRRRFSPQFTHQVLFGNNVLHGQRLRRGVALQTFLTSVQQLEMALGWLAQYYQNAFIRDRLVSWVVHVCLQQFRIDVLGRLKREIRTEQRAETLNGREPFCMEYFREILSEKVHMISGNRCDVKRVSTLIHLLFDFDDEFARTHWEDVPFRKLYRRATMGLRARDVQGAEYDQVSSLEELFNQRFWATLLTHHWILPYPSRDTFMQKTKGGKRMWYSLIKHDVDVGNVGDNTNDIQEGEVRRARSETARKERMRREQEECVGDVRWVWGRKSWQPGRPQILPAWIKWEANQWKEWVERAERQHHTSVSRVSESDVLCEQGFA